MQTNLVKVTINSEAFTLDGDWESISVSKDYDINTLVALGHHHQELICEDLEELLNQEYENNPNYLGLGDTYITCHVGKLENVVLHGNEFIPQLRGLHGKTTAYASTFTTNMFNNMLNTQSQPRQLNAIEQYVETVRDMDLWDIAKLAVTGNLPHGLQVAIDNVPDINSFQTDENFRLLVEEDTNWFRITFIYIRDADTVGDDFLELQVYESTSMRELVQFYRNMGVDDYEQIEEVNGKHY